MTGSFDWSLKGQLALVSFIVAFKGIGPMLEKGMEKGFKPYFDKLQEKLGKDFELKFKTRLEELTKKGDALAIRMVDAIGPEGKQILKEYNNLPNKAYGSPEGQNLAADLAKIDHEIAEVKEKGGEDSEIRLLELQEVRREVDGAMQDLLAGAKNGPEGQALMAKYRALVDRKLNSPGGSDLWFASAQLSRDWISLMESSPELIQFFDKEFPGLRNSQKEAAVEYDWLSMKTMAQEEAFEKGNPFGMKNLHDRYNSAAGADLIRKLPEMMGDNARHPIYIDVDSNGVIEVTLTVVNGKVAVGDPIRIEPKEKPTYEQIEAMRDEIPKEKRGRIVDAESIEGTPAPRGKGPISWSRRSSPLRRSGRPMPAVNYDPKGSPPLTPANFLKMAKGTVADLKALNQKIATEKDEGRVLEMKELKREIEGGLADLVSHTLQSPGGESLLARYMGLANLHGPAGEKWSAEELRFAKEWVQVMQSSPELKDFFDRIFPGLREEQGKIAGENCSGAGSAGVAMKPKGEKPSVATDAFLEGKKVAGDF